jgi:hypothetical protein
MLGHIRKNQQYSLICTIPLFYVLSHTCFDSSLPSLGNFLDPSELPEIQIGWVVYLKYVTDKKSQYVIYTDYFCVLYILILCVCYIL